MITFFSLISGLFMSIIYCLLHIGVRLGQRSILNRHAGRRRPRILEFGVQKKSSVTELSVNFHPCINTLRPRQDGCHFPDDILKWIFLNENS